MCLLPPARPSSAVQGFRLPDLRPPGSIDRGSVVGPNAGRHFCLDVLPIRRLQWLTSRGQGKDRRPRPLRTISIAPRRLIDGKPVSSKESSPRCSTLHSPTAASSATMQVHNPTALCGSRRWLTCCSASCAQDQRSATPSSADATCGTIRLKLLKIGCPGPLRRRYRRHQAFCHGLGLSLVQHRVPPLAGTSMLQRADDVHRSAEHRMCWLSADVPCKPPGAAPRSRTLRGYAHDAT